MENQEKNIERFKQRFQFLVTITLFFPVLMDALFKEVNNVLDINKTMLSWGAIIAVLIFDYILLECTKKFIFGWISKLINISLFINIGSFAIVFYTFAKLQQTGLILGFLTPLFIVAMKSLLYIPIIVGAILFLNIWVLFAKKI